ncbi:MAG: ribose 5-phosphate isomerase B [Candidatus Latescibacterota bacterium]|nr:MAG: ribose 5-phosphate isomerase B [Candidatus Latescibacterota bacterium]
MSAAARGGAQPGSGPVAIGADHGGFRLKETLRRYLQEELGVRAIDCGAFSSDAVDYPDIAAAVARRVASGECARGIAIDGAGIGSSIAANKIPGIRAAVCHDERTARSSRAHNDANVLCLGASVVGVGEARRLVRIWLSAPFEGGRHQRRVDQILALEQSPRPAEEGRETR